MQFHRATISSVSSVLPDKLVTSAELEQRLSPLYERLHLPEGRLEMMTGIASRGFWPADTLPSQVASRAAYSALSSAGLTAGDLDALIFCSVSRDCAEPATSSIVHHELGMRSNALNFDISNACLGMVSGILVLANMVELGQIRCGIAVCGENAGPLVETTIAKLNADLAITRNDVKGQFASLTIGSAGAAIIVTADDFPCKAHHRLLAASVSCDTSGSVLCRGNVSGGMTSGNNATMATDSHQLMVQGVAAANDMWQSLKVASGWSESTPDIICGHQVGKFHRELLYETLRLDLNKDFSTFQKYGNCGSASLPMTVSLAEQSGRLAAGMKLAMLGIGSGINASGLAILW